MKLNSAYVHITINHTPILATLFGSGLLAYGLWRKSKTVENCGHALFLIGAASTIPTVISGLGARDIVRPLPGVPEELIQKHVQSAAASTALSWSLATVAVRAMRHNGQGPRSKSALVISLLTNAAMFVAAHYGGEVRHSEVR